MALIRALRSQTRMSLTIGISCIILTIMWCLYTRDYSRTIQIANERCASELSSVRYQLEVVSEYKKKMEWILTEAQKEHQVEKDHVKEMMDNYAALKHHLYICEAQTEELEKECLKLKEESNKAKQDLKELENVKQELDKCQKPTT